MYEQIVIDIKENGRFCIWRYEKQQERRTKVPYQINGQRQVAGTLRISQILRKF